VKWWNICMRRQEHISSGAAASLLKGIERLCR
jgi:hypothetical protein